MPFALILSSYVAASRVGGGAQALALAPFGIDAAVIPSVMFGRHPDWGAPGGGAVDAQTMREMIDAVAAYGLHAQTDAVISGYFVDAAQVRLAKVEAKAQVRKAHETRQALTEESRRHIRLAGLGHVLARLVPHPVQADPRPVVEKVSNRHGPGRKSRSAKLQKAVAHPARTPRRPEPARYAQAPRPAKAHPFIPPPKPVGLMKVSNRPRCASADPGAALVCADPSLGAADRQLARAYRQAQAAGVSDERLQRQQQRWLAARSAAAREAPWAVRDVYVARIAELNGMAQEAGGGAN